MGSTDYVAAKAAKAANVDSNDDAERTPGLTYIAGRSAMNLRSQMDTDHLHQIDGVEFVFGLHPELGQLIIITGCTDQTPALIIKREIFSH